MFICLFSEINFKDSFLEKMICMTILFYQFSNIATYKRKDKSASLFNLNELYITSSEISAGENTEFFIICIKMIRQCTV